MFALAALLAVAAERADAGDEAPDSPVSCELSVEALEASGARIGDIQVKALDIFDLGDPEDDKALFRLMNRLLVRTRDPVIKRQLLFDADEPFSGQRLDESKPGSGLGLSIVTDLAGLYGGKLTLSDAPIGGLRAELVLPAV
jgi:hypothetical protein